MAGTQAYLSLPTSAAAPLPAVIVIHEWWGLNDHIRHWADRLAADGYAALAVDLDGGQVATDPEGAMALMKQVDEAQALAQLEAAHEFLAAEHRYDAVHAFANPSNAKYDQAAAADAWSHVREFLAEHLQGKRSAHRVPGRAGGKKVPSR